MKTFREFGPHERKQLSLYTVITAWFRKTDRTGCIFLPVFFLADVEKKNLVIRVASCLALDECYIYNTAKDYPNHN